MLTVVIPYRDNPEGVRRLLPTIGDLPVIVVDDCSAEPLVLRRANVKVIRLAERGYFSGAVNAGIAACDTDVLVLNQDIILEEGWLSKLSQSTSGYGIVGDGVMGHPAHPTGYVQGTFMWMSREAISSVGLLDGVNWPLWGATAEWQLRACRKGFKANPIKTDWVKHFRKGNFGTSIQATLDENPEKQGWFIRTPPLVSVVCACYNYGRFLTDWVNSLIGGNTCLGEMGQTFQGFEAIIVDDCSTDDSWRIAQSLADPWKGVRAYRRTVNGGTARALNDGIKNAYGRYIMTVDADDMLEPRALEILLGKIQADPSKLFYTDQQVVRAGKRVEILRTRPYNFGKLLEWNMVPAGTMFAKSAWEEVGGYPPAFAKGRQDWAFAVAMGIKGHCGERVGQPLYLYRRDGHNRSLRNTNPSDRREFSAQMQSTFPKIYQAYAKGETVGGCCGGRATTFTSRLLSDVYKTMDIGATGFVLLEYQGKNTGRQLWTGDVTRTRYMTKGTKPRILVDVRDAPALLEIVSDHRMAFNVVNVQEEPVQELESA